LSLGKSEGTMGKKTYKQPNQNCVLTTQFFWHQNC
jgi:hypothetical protein